MPFRCRINIQDLLQAQGIRLHELSEKIDKFILVEFTIGLTGQKKLFIFLKKRTLCEVFR
jgi:hypothetical protein